MDGFLCDQILELRQALDLNRFFNVINGVSSPSDIIAAATATATAAAPGTDSNTTNTSAGSGAVCDSEFHARRTEFTRDVSQRDDEVGTVFMAPGSVGMSSAAAAAAAAGGGSRQGLGVGTVLRLGAIDVSRSRSEDEAVAAGDGIKTGSPVEQSGGSAGAAPSRAQFRRANSDRTPG